MFFIQLLCVDKFHWFMSNINMRETYKIDSNLITSVEIIFAWFQKKVCQKKKRAILESLLSTKRFPTAA